jgi:hypothetical protein
LLSRIIASSASTQPTPTFTHQALPVFTARLLETAHARHSEFGRRPRTFDDVESMVGGQPRESRANERTKRETARQCYEIPDKPRPGHVLPPNANPAYEVECKTAVPLKTSTAPTTTKPASLVPSAEIIRIPVRPGQPEVCASWGWGSIGFGMSKMFRWQLFRVPCDSAPRT